MDYAEIANVTRHAGWEAFEAGLAGRLMLFTTAGVVRLPEARFDAEDTLLFGSESGGVPVEVHERADLRVRIPQVAGTRSLNLAVAAGIAVAEAADSALIMRRRALMYPRPRLEPAQRAAQWAQRRHPREQSCFGVG
jgi:tRNA(Leu) C34 or U34 (ribose-2'-O)-methylase TrmL